MNAASTIDADVVIFGGGCAGLWLLDALRRRGARVVLLEAHRLGAGQTISAQGILHGGVKYSLAGILSPSARMVRDMPAVWQASLEGRGEPDLSAVRLRSEFCYLWRHASLKSWTGMLGATMALRVKPTTVPEAEVPEPLAGCPRPVYRLAEPVIQPASFLEAMTLRNAGLIWKFDAEHGLEFEQSSRGDAPLSLRLVHPDTREPVRLRPRYAVLTAGEGNQSLRERSGCERRAMQRRPLRVALVRGQLPPLHGHCIEGARTKVTITTDVDAAGRSVWQLGGQVAEDGAGMEAKAFLRHARAELQSALPGWKLPDAEWTSYLVDRAEGFATGGSLPGDVQIAREGNVISAWPTKLVLAPSLSQRIIDSLELPADADVSRWRRLLADARWPSPEVALPPWEEDRTWSSDV